ncbi:MAG TPA: hypothetical protein VHZ95_01360, partial [Polyangiales bacterium]|nr:hypothetical protein [Polyangiales bacterium]
MRPARWQWFVLCALLSVERLAAQDSARGDQVIADPELRASEPAANSGDRVIADPELAGSGDASVADGGDDVIADPELATTPSREALPAPASSAQPEAADVRMVLHTRGWRDWRTSDAREEVWDETTVVAIEATMRRSDSLRFSLGVVAQYHYARLEHAVPDAGAARYEFDAMPTSAYVDATIAAGLHVRVGYQPVHLGRFDAFSATNVLSVYDARQGPATLPEVPEVGQFAALVDYDPLSWLSIRAIYIPFFTPNIVSVSEGDYPLLGIKQTAINQVFDPQNHIVSDNQLR